VREVAAATLEGERHLALRVRLPADPTRDGLFVYRVEGARLVPRFLGSGFPARRLTGVTSEGASLRVRTDAGALRCVLQDFPLVCEEAP